MGTAYQDIGEINVGPLLSIKIGADGSFQVRHAAKTDYQFNPPASALGDAGVLLADLTNGRLYAPDFANHDDTDVSISYNTWDPHSQSVVMTADGVSRVITTLQTLGDDLTVILIDSYVHGQNCWRTDIIIQNVTTTDYDVILYRMADVYLNGSNNGYGATRAGGIVGVTENEDNDPVGNALWLAPLVADQYEEDDPTTLWSKLESLADLDNTVIATSDDAACCVAWELSIPGRSMVVRSCVTQIDIAAPVVPPALDIWHFHGYCYQGPDGNMQTPLSGVKVNLYVGATNNFASATLKRFNTSDLSGFWYLVDEQYTYYWVEAVVPAGMTATGVSTGDGTIISDTLLRWGPNPARGVHASNRFFME